MATRIAAPTRSMGRRRRQHKRNHHPLHCPCGAQSGRHSHGHACEHALNTNCRMFRGASSAAHPSHSAWTAPNPASPVFVWPATCAVDCPGPISSRAHELAPRLSRGTCAVRSLDPVCCARRCAAFIAILPSSVALHAAARTLDLLRHAGHGHHGWSRGPTPALPETLFPIHVCTLGVCPAPLRPFFFALAVTAVGTEDAATSPAEKRTPNAEPESKGGVGQ